MPHILMRRQILLCCAPPRKLTGVCFSGDLFRKGTEIGINKLQGDGGEEEQSGEKEKGNGGIGLGALGGLDGLGGLLGGSDDKKDGGE